MFVISTVDVMIEVIGLTKRYGDVLALSDVSFGVRPGRVTGFLGPNGAGKSTTMRVILGLDFPTAGRVLVDGKRYNQLTAPLRTIGSLLDAKAVHPGRTAANHLLALARSNGIDARRVAETLNLVGLADVAGRRCGTFSLGMSQRLGIAAALLGDPPILMLDEPINGLDTEGIRWIRDLLKDLAADGRTVFLSSHVMSELELTADHVVVIGRGRIVADATIDEFIRQHSDAVTVVRSDDDDALLRAFGSSDATVTARLGGGWEVRGLDPVAVGTTARDLGIAVRELRSVQSSLEDVYSRVTGSDTEFRARREAGVPR